MIDIERALTAVGLILNMIASCCLYCISDKYTKCYINLHSPEKSDPNSYGQMRIELEKNFRLKIKIVFGVLILGFLLQLIPLIFRLFAELCG